MNPPHFKKERINQKKHVIQETGAKTEKDKNNPQFVEAGKGMDSQKMKLMFWIYWVGLYTSLWDLKDESVLTRLKIS